MGVSFARSTAASAVSDSLTFLRFIRVGKTTRRLPSSASLIADKGSIQIVSSVSEPSWMQYAHLEFLPPRSAYQIVSSLLLGLSNGQKGLRGRLLQLDFQQ